MKDGGPSDQLGPHSSPNPPGPPGPPWDWMMFSSRRCINFLHGGFRSGCCYSPCHMTIPAPYLGGVNRAIPGDVTRSHLSAQCLFFICPKCKRFHGLSHCASCHMTNTPSLESRPGPTFWLVSQESFAHRALVC